ncbi:MAG: hypothetical protein M1833_004407 [Piccolia ochrophora]|nr:MAG: hypothetical protein M1833_004407 [Piccolia ochrophora]
MQFDRRWALQLALAASFVFPAAAIINNDNDALQRRATDSPVQRRVFIGVQQDILPQEIMYLPLYRTTVVPTSVFVWMDGPQVFHITMETEKEVWGHKKLKPRVRLQEVRPGTMKLPTPRPPRSGVLWQGVAGMSYREVFEVGSTTIATAEELIAEIASVWSLDWMYRVGSPTPQTRMDGGTDWVLNADFQFLEKLLSRICFGGEDFTRSWPQELKNLIHRGNLWFWYKGTVQAEPVTELYYDALAANGAKMMRQIMNIQTPSTPKFVGVDTLQASALNAGYRMIDFDDAEYTRLNPLLASQQGVNAPPPAAGSSNPRFATPMKH